MFTQGLNGSSLRWAQEDGGFKKGKVPVYSGIPTMPASWGPTVNIRFESDMEMSSDSEGEVYVYGDRYSLDSSPQDDKHGSGVSSSGSVPLGLHKQGRGSTNYESSDSGARARGGGVVHRKMDPSAGFYSNANGSSQDVGRGGNRNKEHSENNLPSAPPLNGSYQDFGCKADQVPTCGNTSTSATRYYVNKSESKFTDANAQGTGNRSDQSLRNSTSVEGAAPLSLPARLPTFHASGQGPWCTMLSYDACVRLCLRLCSKGSTEAQIFLDNECALLQNAFGLQKVLLQPEEELLLERPSQLVRESTTSKTKKNLGKMKVQVRKVKMDIDPPTGCSFPSLKSPNLNMESVRVHVTNFTSTLSSGWKALKKVRVTSHAPENASFSQKSLSYLNAGMKEVVELIKSGVTGLRGSSSSYDVVSETYSCLLRLKSSSEEDAVRMQPGSGETHLFFPDSLGDDLIIEIQDSKGKYVGRVLAQVALIADDPSDKLRWWTIYREPEHELVGRTQLHIYYSSSPDENSHLKCGSIAETVAYDLVLEVGMKIQHFQQRNLLLHNPWKWLLTEFASFYGVSDTYARLRYLSYIMDVATPTADCLVLVHDLIFPVLMKGDTKKTLSHQENRILGEIVDQAEQTLSLVFENYKSLDESSLSGMMEIFRPATGLAPPALEPAIKLYTLIHDIFSPEVQLQLCKYFQAAARKRSRRHVAETDEFVSATNENAMMDSMTLCTAYQKMRSLCLNMRNEISTDIDIHNQHILPSFVDLPNLSSSIYSFELCNRIRAFLVACPPPGPLTPVVELVIAAADFQRDLADWNIDHVKGGVVAKELFHSYISHWIKDKRLTFLDLCKGDKVKWSSVRVQHSTTPFVDDMYQQLTEMLKEYEVIISRWPEYIFPLEKALADVEKAIMEALDKQYADVLSPLKENLTSKIFGLKYVQKFAKGTVCTYTVPDELGILLNSMRRMIDLLRPKIESRFKSWGSYIPDGGNVPGEHLSEITVMLRAKFKNYLQAVVEKLAENTRMLSMTRLKNIVKGSKETEVESDLRSRMQPLKDLLTNTIDHLHSVFETHVFISVCRGFWDQMGQDILRFLEHKKENRSWYNGSRIAVSIVDDIFASQMQQLLGNSLQVKDVEPPRSIVEVRSMLCKDAQTQNDDYYY